MAQTTLHQILEQIKTLDPNELEQVRRAVQERLGPQEETRQRGTFHQALRAAGLVKQFKTPRVDVSERRLVHAQGQPVSETIIEERL